MYPHHFYGLDILFIVSTILFIILVIDLFWISRKRKKDK